MNFGFRNVFSTFCVTLLFVVTVSAEETKETPQVIPFEKGPYKVRVERSHFVEMRDGIRLMTDLYFPEGYEGKIPVILERTPYNKGAMRNADHEKPITLSSKAYYYASHGFVFAVQDRRGKFESEGDYTIGYGDIEDAEDTLNWFEEQPWFNGNVGMIGCSIPGGNVIKAAMSQHKSLKGLVPQSAGFGHGTAGGTLAYGFIRGGVQNMTMPLWTHTAGSKLFFRPSKKLDREEYLKIVDYFNPAPDMGAYLAGAIDPETGDFSEETYKTLLHLPLVDIDDQMGSPPSDWDNIISRGPLDPWWLAGDYLDDGEKVSGGALHVNSWHDYSAKETFLQYEHFRKHATTKWARENQYVLMGPLGHCAIEALSSNTINGERNIGDARFDVWGTYLRWWDYTLKGNKDSFKDTPRIQYYLPGANQWKSSEIWPIEGTTPTKLYLSGGGDAHKVVSNGTLTWSKPNAEKSDRYVYDPANPIIQFMQSINMGSSDWSELEKRPDILVYTTEPLESDVEITGTMRARIWVSTDVPDTDLSVQLMDVYPDGRSMGVRGGYLRLRYRDGFDKEVMMQPGKLYPVDVDLLVGANLFKKGHRIRVQIASSNFPAYARNLNTGGDNARETEYQSATVTIHHGPETPSYVELPVIK